MAAAGISTDGSGIFFVTNGNGTFDANSGGPDYRDSAVRLRSSSSGSGLTVNDWSTPVDQSTLNGQDLDFGTGGPLLLPTQSGSIPHLLASTDKDGRIYIVNRDNWDTSAAPAGSNISISANGTANAIVWAIDYSPITSLFESPT